MIADLQTIVALIVSLVATGWVVADDAPRAAASSSIGDAAWFRQADKDGDGKLSREEAPNKDAFANADTDGDGFATADELQTWFAKRPRRAANQPRESIPTRTQSRNRSTVSPDKFEKREVTIWSDGTRMAGDLYLPKNLQTGAKRPAIVFCAGTGGTKAGTGGRLGPIFAANGYVALAFDYRGWGTSESQLMAVQPQPTPDENGEMMIKVRALRWQMNYTDQTEDIRAAISFLAGEPSVDADRIGIIGSSYGGGLVTWVAGNDPRVKCIVAQVPGLGGSRTPAAEQRVFRLHTQQARGETEPVPVETGKLGGKMSRYEHMRRNPAKSIGFSAVEAAEGINVPAMFVLAENEELGNNDNVQRIHQAIKARGVPSELHVIKGISHYGIYREGFEEATNLELAFFQRHLQGTEPEASADSTEDPLVPDTPFKSTKP